MTRTHRIPAEADGVQLWQKTQYPGLVRTAPSATTFARIKAKGKLIRHPLRTNANQEIGGKKAVFRRFGVSVSGEQ